MNNKNIYSSEDLRLAHLTKNKSAKIIPYHTSSSMETNDNINSDSAFKTNFNKQSEIDTILLKENIYHDCY